MQSNLIKQLKVGQVIKNYKELCEIFDLEYKVGNTNSRTAQIKEIERFYKLDRQGHKFIVAEVYSEILEKEDGRATNGGNNTKYHDLMDRVVINFLIDYGYVEDSFSRILDNLFLLDRKYESLSKTGYKTFAEINRLSVGVTKIYQQQLINITKTCLETSLNRLNRQDIIRYEKKILVRDKGLKDELADTQMQILISMAEEKAYKKMENEFIKIGKKYNPDRLYQYRINPETNQKFKREVAKELDILSYWNVYCIELVDKNTEYVEEDRDELIRRLIKSVVEQVRKHKQKDNNGNVYLPYSFAKYDEQIDKLTRILWDLPENYETPTETKEIMQKLFGNDIDEEETTEYLIDCCVEGYYPTDESNIPF